MDLLRCFRVTDAWVTRPLPLKVNLDFLGATEGSIDKEPEPNVFALIGTIMAHGRPAYYSEELDAISTDPYFATHPAPVQPFLPGHPLKVVDTDLLWRFAKKSGTLILHLQNRSVHYLDFSDPSLLAGWALTCRTHAVVFDGTFLKSRPDLGVQKDPPVASTSSATRVF